MKLSPDRKHLSEEELKKVLDGTADEKIKKLLSDCDLSQEAVAGFMAVPGAISEMSSLKKNIASKSGYGMSSMKMNLLATAVAIVIVGIPAYFFWPRNTEDDDIIKGLKRPIAQMNDPEHGPANIPPVLTPQIEHFVNPEAKPQPKYSPVKANTDSGKALHIPITEADPIDIAPPELLEQEPVTPTHPEIGYNAQMGFMYDLKITEFDKYYTKKTIEVKDIPLHGVPAEFEDAHAANEASHNETVRQVPAEKFLKEGLLAFRDLRFGKCIEKMEVLAKNNPNDLNAAFYMGVCYVKLEMHARAIPYLDQVLDSPNNIFHEEANWYKALALLGLGNKDAAMFILNSISANDGFYKQQAADKIKELNK